jgi:hypothetical protein
LQRRLERGDVALVLQGIANMQDEPRMAAVLVVIDNDVELDIGEGFDDDYGPTHKVPSKPPEGSGYIEIVFPNELSISLNEELIRHGFSFINNTGSGWSGEWLIDMAEKIVMERGEIKLKPSKGKFDRWL